VDVIGKDFPVREALLGCLGTLLAALVLGLLLAMVAV